MLNKWTARALLSRSIFLLHEAVPTAYETAQCLLPDLDLDSVRQPELHRLSVHFNVAQMMIRVIASGLLATLPIADVRIDGPSMGQLSVVRR
jgi:hypothetical protein